jgi:hypothetical protein
MRVICSACRRQEIYEILVGKPVGKRLLERHRNRWEDNIKINLKARGCGLDSSGSG